MADIAPHYIEGKPYKSLPFEPHEIDALLKAGLVDIIAGEFCFRMVGVAAINKKLLYIVPKFETLTSSGERPGPKYVRILKRYLTSGTKRTSEEATVDDVPFIIKTFEELNAYYLKNGIYQERKRVTVKSNVKKINWPKTIHRNVAVFSNSSETRIPQYSVIYPTPTSIASTNFDGEATRLFKTVLSLLATFLAPILRFNHPLEQPRNISHIIDEISNTLKRSSYYKRVLHRHIVSETGARRRIMKVLYRFTSADSDGIARIFGNKVFVFGTKNFEYVWEDAINQCLGAERESKVLAQPQPTTSNPRQFSISNQRADGVIMPSERRPDLVIIDAKYYLPKEGKQSFSLPVGDAMKQFGYGVSARDFIGRERVKNFLIFPLKCDSSNLAEDYGDIALIRNGCTLADVDPIRTRAFHPHAVFETYLNRTVNTALLASLSELDPVQPSQLPYDWSDRGLYLPDILRLSASRDGRDGIFDLDLLSEAKAKSITLFGETFVLDEPERLFFRSTTSDRLLYPLFNTKSTVYTGKSKIHIRKEVLDSEWTDRIHMVLFAGAGQSILISAAALKPYRRRMKEEHRNSSSHYVFYLNCSTNEFAEILLKSVGAKAVMKLPMKN